MACRKKWGHDDYFSNEAELQKAEIITKLKSEAPCYDKKRIHK